MDKRIHAVDRSFFAKGKSRTYCGRQAEKVAIVNKRSMLTCKQCLRLLNSRWTWRDENPNW